MLKEIIEWKRQKLYQTVGLTGLSSEEAIELSCELERFMTFHNRIHGPFADRKETQATVHANALHNILGIAAAERLDLPFEMDSKLLHYAEWFRIEAVHTLLQAITDRYGTDVVEYMGEFVPKHCIFPENVQTFRDSLHHLNTIFHLNHKSSSYIGEYLPYMDIKNEITMFCHTPNYSSAFNYGIVKGLAKKFNQSLHIKVIDKAHGGQFKIVG